SSPHLGIDPDGGYSIVWSMGNKSIYYNQFILRKDYYIQRLMPGESQLSEPRLCIPAEDPNEQTNPVIAGVSDDEYIIIWSHHHWNKNAIVARLFQPGKIPIGTQIILTDELEISYNHRPAVAAIPDSSILIVWDDGTDTDSHIYGRVIDPYGNPMGAAFQLDYGETIAARTHPLAVNAGEHGYLVAWGNITDHESTIIGQKISASGSMIDTNFSISEPAGVPNADQFALASAEEDTIAVVWRDITPFRAETIKVQVFSWDAPLSGLPTLVTDSSIASEKADPQIAYSKEQKSFLVTWSDDRNGDTDIFGRFLTSSGLSLGPTYRLFEPSNTTVQKKNQWRPRVWSLSSGGYFLSWGSGGGHIHAQQYATLIDSSGHVSQSAENILVLPDSLIYDITLHADMIMLATQDLQRVDEWFYYNRFNDIYLYEFPLACFEEDTGTVAISFIESPTSFHLLSNYPNPFNPATTIGFELPAATNITLIVYDLTGREVTRLADRGYQAGYHQVVWDGRNASGRLLPSGIYIARLTTPGYSNSIKMLLLK
ncbi:MAG: T9SS type A sorting domain-containing protein, partial [Candidatus Marinimicrobia bacterium]|nr:T9SS type A sorting domain-containing protein [Candidatus Neomarinimicrobiota bacterium]